MSHPAPRPAPPRAAVPTDGTRRSPLPLLRSRAPRGSTREAVITGLRYMSVLSWFLVVPVSLGPVVDNDLRVHGHLQVATIVLLVAQVPALVGLVTTWVNEWTLWGTGLLYLGALLAWVPHRGELDPVGLWSPGYWTVAWACWGVIVVPKRTYRLLAGTGSLAFMLVDLLVMVHQHVPLTGLNLAPLPWFAVPTALSTLMGHGLIDLATTADHQAARRRRAERTRHAQAASFDGAREAARLLHDHILHALNALGRPGTVPPAMVVQECRYAIAAVESANAEVPQVRLEQLVAEDPALGAAGATLTGSSDPLPGGVAQALAAAAHEALTNVARHAAASTCHVVVEQQPAQWRLTVTDDGRGFHPDRTPVGRLGLTRSVVERVSDAGGSAEITSAPGRGTSVELCWPASADPSTTAHLPTRASGEMRVMLARTSWPMLFVSALMAVLVGGLAHPSWPLRLTAGVLVALGTMTTVLLERRRMQPWWSVTLLVLALGAWWLNLRLVEQPVPNSYHLWLGWTCAAIVHLVVLQLRPRRAAEALVAWSVPAYLMLWHAVGRAQFLHLHGSLTTGLGECAVAMTGLWVAGRIAEDNARQATTAEALRRATAQMEVEWHVEQFWSQRVTGVAMPLLHAVADGDVDVTAPSVQSRARQLEQTLRDELVLGPANRPILQSLAQLRADGWMVRSLLSIDDPSETLQRLSEVLPYLGAAHVPGQGVTLSTSSRDGIALVLDPSDRQRTVWTTLVAREGGSLDGDETFARIRVPLDPGSAPAGPGLNAR